MEQRALACSDNAPRIAVARIRCLEDGDANSRAAVMIVTEVARRTFPASARLQCHSLVLSRNTVCACDPRTISPVEERPLI